ncbi:MAG: hypothetical protein JNJ57_00835 [Saprospiraceae bacterium]|nr:hypothetical protein [Saprospiraceae bacterium]
MKRIFFLLAFIGSCSAFAQNTDTVFVSISNDTSAFIEPSFKNTYDEVFRTQVPSKWLFKLDVGSLLPQVGQNTEGAGNQSSGFNVNIEHKFTTGLSVNAGYKYTFGFGDNNFVSDFIDYHVFSVEPRWYYQMPKHVRQGKAANNFSGNYLGLEYQHARNVKNQNLLSGGISNAATLRFGLQRRLFRYGYFDMSYGLGVHQQEPTPYSRGGSRVIGNARFAVGLALATPKASTETKPDMCDALQCFREERKLWKVDLFNLLRIQSLDNIKTKLSLAREQKLGDSPLSIEYSGAITASRLRYDLNDINDTEFKSFGLGAELQLQGRYYYSLMRRIAQGKSGNNLSGAYVALVGRSSIEYFNFQWAPLVPNIANGVSSVAGWDAGIVWGVQYRIFKHGYIDFNIGPGLGNRWRNTQPEGQPSIKSVDTTQLTVFGGLKIGWAF